MKKVLYAAAAATAFVASAASAAVIFDETTGTGFVGKGDVQLALGLNNAGLQALGNPTFTYESVTENSWDCVKIVVTGNGSIREIVQERNNMRGVSGLVSSIARVKNQITGYNLSGYSSTSHTTDGPATGSCPNDNSEFVEGSVQSLTIGGGLSVNGVPLQ